MIDFSALPPFEFSPPGSASFQAIESGGVDGVGAGADPFGLHFNFDLLDPSSHL